MAAVERSHVIMVDSGGGTKPVLSPEVLKTQLDGLMERLRNKSNHFKSWTENAKALKAALVDKRHVLESSEKTQLQKCLDTLQKSIKVSSLQSMVERLESISRQLGLKLTVEPGGTDCFISSDMFYVEVLLEVEGTVKDIKISHHGSGDPVSCLELTDVLSKGDFTEFTRHLEGLSAMYQLNADTKQKSKAFLALQALETDLTMLSQLQSSINDPCNLVHKSPVGILQTRRGGHPMKLTYFISPYDLLDMDSKTLIPLSVDTVIEKQLGYSVMVCIESSTAHKLQNQSLMSISRTHDGKSLPSFAAPSNLNSITLPANFVLKLDTPMPLAVTLVKKIQGVTHIECADNGTSQPLLKLISQLASKGEIDSHNQGLFVTLPDQHHCYFLSGGYYLQGVMVSSIPFTHPTHVPQILIFLRQQALFNTLISSCIRPQSKQDVESAMMFEVSALSWLHVSVSFEHPIEESMATAEFDLSDITTVKCKVHTMPNEALICSDDYASKVIQRCLSIPITMRALIRKSQERHMMQPRSHQINGGDILLNMVSSATSTNSTSNQGNLLSRPSPFLESGGGQSNQFATDFDVKLNVRSKSLVAATSSNGTSSVQSDNSTDVKMEDLSQKQSYVSNTDLDPHQNYLETSNTSSNVECTATNNNNQGNLFSISPEKTSPLTNSTVPQLGNVFSQAALQIQQASSTKVTGTATPPTKVIGTAGPPASGGGKPNAMLMNLLNDVPQGQPMSISGSTQNLKPRKQRKRKALGAEGTTASSNNSSPRSTTGRSPKRKISEDDGSGKDTFNMDTESNDSLSVGFPESGPTPNDSQQILEVISRSEPPDIASTSPNYSELNFPAERNFTPSTRPSNFHLKTEPAEFEIDKTDSKSNSSKNEEKPNFALSTTNLSKSSGSTSNNEKIKEIKKVKKPKADVTVKEEKDISLGKEIEKIPIIFDITSSVDGRTIEVSRNSEHVDRRPNVEIIPLGTNSSTTTTSSNVQTTAALNAFNSSLKMNKSDSKDLFKRVRRIVSSDNLERKNKVDGKKDRKRKRVESVDGLGVDEAVLKAPKIINLITPIPSNAGISVLDKNMAIVTTSSTTSLQKHESVMRPVTLNMKSPLGSSTNTSAFSTGSKTPTTPTGTVKRNFLSSPTVSPTLSVSPNKPVSILKASQHQHPSLVNKSKQNVSKSSMKSNHSNDVNKVHMKVQNKNRISSGSKNAVAHSISGVNVGMSSSAGGKVPTKPATVKLKQLNLNQSGSSSAPTTPTSSAPSTPRAVTSPSVNQRGTSLNSSGLVLTSIPTSPTMSSTTLAISPNNLSTTSTNSGGANLVKIPMSAVNANVSLNALIAAQKVNKSAVARSRKGSLSAVIDKLMASSMQHTGGVGDSLQPDQMPLCKSELQNLAAMKIDGLPERYQLKKEGQSGQSQTKGQAKVNQSDSGGKNVGDTPTKKAEFTVKQSSQGIKLTVTKTHCSESGSKLSSSVRGSKFGSSGSFHKSGSPSKFSGSSTGLKPGVNSGPASKKSYTPPSSKSANGSVSPSKSLTQSAQSAVQKTSVSPVPSLSNAIFSPNKSSSNSSVPRPGKFAGGSANEAKTSSSNKSPKSQDNRPPTPKMIAIPSSTAFTMPPPPPPPETTTSASGKKNDSETLRHSPVRQFTKHRDSPVEESETEKAFQRLLQAQGNPGSVSNSSSNNNSNGVTLQKTVTNGPMTDIVNVSKDSSIVSQRPESVKGESPGGRTTPKPVSPSLTPFRASPVDTAKRPPTPKMELANFKTDSAIQISANQNLPVEPILKKFKTPNSPEENLVMDFPVIQQLQQHNASLTDMKLVKPIPLTPQTPLVPSTLLSPPPPPPPPPPQPILNSQVVLSSLNIDNQPPLPPSISSSQPQQTPLTPKSPTIESGNRPQQQAFSPLVVQPLKSPAQPSTPAMAHTPQSEHSNPSSVAHSSPYDIDDDLMDEALVGLGK